MQRGILLYKQIVKGWQLHFNVAPIVSVHWLNLLYQTPELVIDSGANNRKPLFSDRLICHKQQRGNHLSNFANGFSHCQFRVLSLLLKTVLW